MVTYHPSHLPHIIMSKLTLEIPEDMSFEQAIALTQSLLAKVEQDELSEPEIEEAIASLVSSAEGARGFFVTYLTDARPLADHPSAAVVQALQTSPETVAELLVKNLAMSAAMAVAHRRNEDEAMAQGSDQVRSRTARLIQLVQLAAVSEEAKKLLESVVTSQGDYQQFLKRWGYDTEQKQVIQQAIEQVL